MWAIDFFEIYDFIENNCILLLFYHRNCIILLYLYPSGCRITPVHIFSCFFGMCMMCMMCFECASIF